MQQQVVSKELERGVCEMFDFILLSEVLAYPFAQPLHFFYVLSLLISLDLLHLYIMSVLLALYLVEGSLFLLRELDALLQPLLTTSNPSFVPVLLDLRPHIFHGRSLLAALQFIFVIRAGDAQGVLESCSGSARAM